MIRCCVQEDAPGWWKGRIGDVFGAVPKTYIEAVKSVPAAFQAQAQYEFNVCGCIAVRSTVLLFNVCLLPLTPCSRRKPQNCPSALGRCSVSLMIR